MYRLGVKRQFSAAHKLEGHPGRCSRLHGHTWTVEAVLRSSKLGPDGLVVDFEDLETALDEAIDPFDHEYLNEVSPFDGLAPTAENVARTIFDRLKVAVEGSSWSAELESVTVWESGEARASFSIE